MGRRLLAEEPAFAAAIDEITYSNLFEGLTKFGPDGSIQPGLAERWDVTEGGRVYDFHLRAGVKFHDGADFAADDVVFSLDRARAEGSVNAQKALFEGIETVTAVSPTQVRVTLKAPDADFPWKMAWGDAVIVDPASADGNATKPVGTGPFKFVEFQANESIKLTKNPDYFKKGLPHLDGIEFTIIPNRSTASRSTRSITS